MKKFRKSLIVLILLVTFAIISSMAITAAIKDNFKREDHGYFNYVIINFPNEHIVQGTCQNYFIHRDNEWIQVTVNNKIYVTSLENVLLIYDPKKETGDN